MTIQPVMYGELAEWFHLISPPDEYAEEAALFARLLRRGNDPGRPSLLELGAGAGCNAFHLKRSFEMTLTDRSSRMLAASRRINPDVAHLEGDMRTLRLKRQFHCVLIHDALDYMLTEDDLLAAIRTAFAHCRPGGRALFVPDHVRDTFKPNLECGGTDDPRDGRRGIRYLEWDSTPEAGSSRYAVDYSLMVRDAGRTRVLHDRHECGLFPRETWHRLIEAAGFRREPLPTLTEQIEVGELFLAERPA